MNTIPKNTQRTAATTPATSGSASSDTGGRKSWWTKGWATITAMVVGFAVVMIVANSIAAAFENPVVALLIGPSLAVLMLWLYRIAIHHIEHRPAVELASKGASRWVLTGLAGGLLLAAATIGILALFGGYQITGGGSIAGALTVIGMMCAVAIAEEVLFRGVIFGLIQRRWGSWLALAVSAILFGLVHLVNPGATFWGAIAVAIEAGLMLGAAYVATGSLWLPIGLHLGWNIGSVAIFGTIGSGGDAQTALVTAITPGPVWLTGGDFGPEASIIAVIVCSFATAVLLGIAHRRGRIVGRRRGI